MATFTFEIGVRHDFHEKADRLLELDPELTDAVVDATGKGTDIIYESARENINKKTGRTRETIEKDVVRGSPGDGATGYVGSDDRVAGYLEYGTSPHEIRAVNGRALAFEWHGRDVFLARVNHPGTPEYAWLLRAGESSEGPIEGVFGEQIESVLARV